MEKIYILNPIPVIEGGIIVGMSLDITIITIKHIAPGVDTVEIKELMLV